MNFHDQLRRQLNFIVTSCRAYDAGHREEGTRIATVSRVLFHNTPSSRSLMSYLGGTGIKMRSTTAYSLSGDKRHPLGFIGMCPSIGGFEAYLDKVARDEQVPLANWWAAEPILELSHNRQTVTRKEVVLDAANKDGGAHVDPKRPPRFTRLEAGLGIVVQGVFSGGVRRTVTLRHANLTILRQIGYEILSSEELGAIANDNR